MSGSSLSRVEHPSLEQYVLLTAAHNEADYIGAVLHSVVAQTVLPRRWVIVSDNSSDQTDEIVASYVRQYDFIRLLHITRPAGRSFGAKVLALREGHKLLDDVDYDFIGNVDADVSFEPGYFEELLKHFLRDPALGLSGGFLYEEFNGVYRGLRTNNARNVCHAAQLMCRECYEAIGGYAVLKYGGEDWHAQTVARMKGWRIEAMPEVKIFHHRHTTGGSSPLRNAFRLGRQDYSFGSDPRFEIMKCLRRIPEKPYVGHALSRLGGFFWSCLRREPRAVSEDFASFLRSEQQERVARVLHRAVGLH